MQLGEKNTALEIAEGGGSDRSSRVATETRDALKDRTPTFAPEQTRNDLIRLSFGHLFVDLRGSRVQRVHQIQQL